MARTARAVPKVNVKSRHREDCKYLGDATKIACGCPKQLTWTRNGTEHRTTADTCDYEVAERKAREMGNSFERAAKGEPEPVKADSIAIEDAVARFIATKQTEGVGIRHIRTIRATFEKSMLTYCNARGLMHVRDIKLTDLESWRDTWTTLGKMTANKQQSRVVGFFEFCLMRGWIDRNIASTMGKIKIKADDHKPTIALSDKQFNQLLAAVDLINGRTTDEERKRFRSLILLQRWTGLAIMDACKLERKRFEQDSNNHGWHRLFMRRAKTGTPVYAALAGEIAKEILGAPNGNPRYLFAAGGTDAQVTNIVQQFGRLYIKLDEVADIKNENGEHVWIHSHMLRDTYAVWLLEHGSPTEDVAALLGHSSIKITEAHYLPWIESRARRMFDRVKSAYERWQSEKS